MKNDHDQEFIPTIHPNVKNKADCRCQSTQGKMEKWPPGHDHHQSLNIVLQYHA